MRTHSAPLSALAVGLVTVLVGACGDPAATGDFEGNPVDELTATVFFSTTGPVIDAMHPRTLVAWITDDVGHTFVPQPDAGVRIEQSFPGSVSVQLLDPPPAEAVRTWEGISGAVALGQLAVYDDQDGDGRFTPKVDLVVGIGLDTVIVYAPTGAHGPLIGDFGRGFHHMAPAECPASPRLAGPAVAVGSLGIYKEATDFFPLVCKVPTACQGATEIRHFCRYLPDSSWCRDCGACVFPVGSTPTQCDDWLPGCETMCPSDECQAEYAICIAGEPPCDTICECQNVYDDCIVKADDPAKCSEKYGDCGGTRGTRPKSPR
ncbi:MAG: hypothetical protein U1F43_14160 [Myxococcota bacterium]